MKITTRPEAITIGQKVIVTVPLYKIEGEVIRTQEAPVSGRVSVWVKFFHPASQKFLTLRYSQRTDGLFRKSGDSKHAATLVFLAK